MITINNVHHRFAHLTTNPAYKRMRRVNTQNTCTLLRLLDPHLLPQVLYIVAVGRTAAIPFFLRLARRQHHQSDLRQPQAANDDAGAHGLGKMVPSSLLGELDSSREGWRQREMAQRRMTSTGRDDDPPARSRTVFPGSVNLYSRCKPHSETNESALSVPELKPCQSTRFRPIDWSIGKPISSIGKPFSSFIARAAPRAQGPETIRWPAVVSRLAVRSSPRSISEH
ncbi:hypothetical protein ACVWWG_001939 [Bradyrhizobium sp. LB7.2]